ncbi:hypothetical protein QBC39DRAFT_69642 [Podospora conica]|nr:hypothetical protein QBC39DRAFT_69642 [Schizothecium conicum]
MLVRLVPMTVVKAVGKCARLCAPHGGEDAVGGYGKQLVAMAATGNRIRPTETQPNASGGIQSSLWLPMLTGGAVAARGQRGRKEDGDLLTHGHGAKREKGRVVEISMLRPTTQEPGRFSAVNLMSVPLRNRDGTWCGRWSGKIQGDSGEQWGGGSLGVLRCDVRRLNSSRRLSRRKRASSVPGNAPTWPAMAIGKAAQRVCRRVGSGMTGQWERLSHYLDRGLLAAVSPVARRRRATVVRFPNVG